MKPITLVFSLDKKNILNSNTFKGLHWAVKGKMTEYLRNEAIREGLSHHEASNIEAVENQLTYITELNNQAIAKSRRTKALLKQGVSAKEAKIKVEEEFASELIERVGDEPNKLFDTFKITVIVQPPTRRRLDPVNLYPTVKALVDGLTDAAWWEDDDFTHLLDISFRYGGTSGEKDTFKITMKVEPVLGDALLEYIRTA